MNDADQSGVDPRLDRLLEEAARTEWQQPAPDPQRFVERLRPQLPETRSPVRKASGWSGLAQTCASLAAAGILAFTLFLVLRPPATEVEPIPALVTTPGDKVEDSHAIADSYLVENLDALERLADVLADDLASGELDLEVCDDLDLIQDTNLESLLAGLLEETG